MERQVKIDMRKRQAFNLSMRGKTPRQIALILGVTIQTVRKYLRDYREIIRDQTDKLNREDYVGDLLSRYDLLWEEAWSNYDNAKKDSERGRWMAALLKIENDRRKALHDLGVIERIGEHSSLDVTINRDPLEYEGDVDRRELDALAALLLAPQMGMSAPEAMSMRARPLQLSEQVGDGMIDATFIEVEPERVPYGQKFDVDGDDA